VTDGARLYFTERRAGRDVLSTVAATGGPIQELDTPFVEARPQSVRAGGRELLVLAGEGEERERALWVLPLPSGKPWRVGNLLCHTASWSPDGKEIAYGTGDDVYLTTDNGVTSHQLQAFTTVPLALRWSPDGKRILIQLRNSGTSDSTFWEIELKGRDGFQAKALIPLNVPKGAYDGVSALLDNDGDAFVSSDRVDFLLHRERFPRQAGFLLTKLRSGLDAVSTLAVDTSAGRLYGLKGSPGQDELVLFNRESHQFRPFLPGVSAHDVAFSRGGQRIAYVKEPENTLWLSAADGSAARQIPTPELTNIELPRWSPDGREIVFMGKRPDSPYRIYMWSPVTGVPHEASEGTDNQGAPTWSPDGKRLVYGRVMCQEEKNCAIEEINLRSGEETMVPGSEGLGTARWSPNGRFIGALRPDRHQVYLLDRQTGKWRKIADGVNGNDIAWSANSQTLYASRPNGKRPEVIQIGIRDGTVAPAVDLSDYGKLSGRIDTWFAIAPDDSILFLHVAGGHEIFKLNYLLR
jgi:Tol biopolymer transport system component